MIIFFSALITVLKVFFLIDKEVMHRDMRNGFVLFEEGDFSILNIAKILIHLFQ